MNQDIDEIHLRKGSDNDIKVQVSGCRRTGTNYTKALIEENFWNAVVHKHDVIWGHGPIPPEYEPLKDAYFIVVCKDPFAWIVSMAKYFAQDKAMACGGCDHNRNKHHPEGCFETVLAYDEGDNLQPETCGCTGYEKPDEPYLHVDNPLFTRTLMEMYCQKYYNWCTHVSGLDRTFLVRYEDLLDDVWDEMRQLGELMPLKRKPELDGFVNLDQEVKPSSDAGRLNFDAGGFDKSFYTDRRYMDYLTDDCQDMVREVWHRPPYKRVRNWLQYEIDEPDHPDDTETPSEMIRIEGHSVVVGTPPEEE